MALSCTVGSAASGALTPTPTPRRRCLHVEEAFTRDVAPERLGSVAESLERWLAVAQEVLAGIEGRVAWTQDATAAAARKKTELEQVGDGWWNSRSSATPPREGVGHVGGAACCGGAAAAAGRWHTPSFACCGLGGWRVQMGASEAWHGRDCLLAELHKQLGTLVHALPRPRAVVDCQALCAGSELVCAHVPRTSVVLLHPLRCKGPGEEGAGMASMAPTRAVLRCVASTLHMRCAVLPPPSTRAAGPGE